MIHEFDLPVAGGTLHAYDTGGSGLPVIWHHGTPNLGSPPRPLLADGIRWISFDRPSYGGSTPQPGRVIGSAAEFSAAVADALSVERFAVAGHSGGGSHALACAALLGPRVIATLAIAPVAPYRSPGLDFFAGMKSPGPLRAALDGREAKARYEASSEGEIAFTDADWETLKGEWGWLGEVAGAASQQGLDGLIDDDLAYVTDWGCSPRDITTPVLIVHGGEDLLVPAAHGQWLATAIPGAELRLYPPEGHISVLRHAHAALEWLPR